MEEKEKMKFSIWVNWEYRIISFQQVDGFEQLQFPTHEEMFRFAVEKGNEGFGIQ